jgi:hypothetical protein
MSGKHWMKPLMDRKVPNSHILVWVDEEERKGRVVAAARRAWLLISNGQQSQLCHLGGFATALELAEKIAVRRKGGGATTVWLARGWSDLVSSGLTEIMDSGAMPHSYASLEGACVLIRAKLRTKQIVISSLAQWWGAGWARAVDWANDKTCGIIWNNAAQLAADAGHPLAEDERRALCALWVIVDTTFSLSSGPPAPTVGAHALRLWRAWLGPRVWTESPQARGVKKVKGSERVQYVAPLPIRPSYAIAGERHSCYAPEVRQFVRGFHDAPIWCCDLRAAYLHALLISPLPVQYVGTFSDLRPVDLADRLNEHTGCALVRVRSLERSYPARTAAGVVPAIGDYWTWLCGAELADALEGERVTECHTAHIWSAKRVSAEDSLRIMSMSASMKQAGNLAHAALWRRLYSSLVGRFAAWRKVWRKIQSAQQFGPWAQWEQADPDTGLIVPHRSIAGHAERMVGRMEASGSVPLVYGIVTATLRMMIRALRDEAGNENVLAVRADEVWVTEAGKKSIDRKASEFYGRPVVTIYKHWFDRAWFDGISKIVSERDGQRFVLLPGAPNDVTFNADGVLSYTVNEPWHHVGRPSAKRGVRRRIQTVTADSIIKSARGPVVRLPQAVRLEHTGVSASLLEPIPYGRTVDDDGR